MAKGSIDLKELNTLADKLAKAASTTEQNIHEAVVKFAYLIDRKAKEKISKGGRTGRSYRRGSIIHTASATGEPPKTDTGRLVSSIRPVLQGRMKAEVGSLTNIAKYGAMLEDGTKNMAARPWLEPTLKENEGALSGLFTAAVKTGGLAQ